MDILTVGDVDFRVLWVGRGKVSLPSTPHEPLNKQFAFQRRYHNSVMGGFQGAVNHQQITIMDAGTEHGVPTRAQEEGGRRITHGNLMQVDLLVNVILCRRGPASLNRRKI